MDLDKNKIWIDIIIRSLKQNMELLEEDYVIAHLDGKRITASEMIKMIEEDNKLVYEFYEDVLGLAVRTIQLRWKKAINESTKIKYDNTKFN